MHQWVWTIIFAPIWLLTVSCLLKVRKVFTLMEKEYERKSEELKK